VKDFCHCARKRATAVKLHETTTNTLQPQGQPTQQTTTLDSSTTSNNDSWHESTNAPEDGKGQYGLGTNLYNTISAQPEVDSGHSCLEHFLDKLEFEYNNMIKKQCKKDTRNIPDRDRILATSLKALSEDPEWSLVQPDKTSQWIPIRITNCINDIMIHLN
jgi:hypothetical protein